MRNGRRVGFPATSHTCACICVRIKRLLQYRARWRTNGSLDAAVIKTERYGG